MSSSSRRERRTNPAPSQHKTKFLRHAQVTRKPAQGPTFQPNRRRESSSSSSSAATTTTTLFHPDVLPQHRFNPENRDTMSRSNQSLYCLVKYDDIAHTDIQHTRLHASANRGGAVTQSATGYYGPAGEAAAPGTVSSKAVHKGPSSNSIPPMPTIHLHNGQPPLTSATVDYMQRRSKPSSSNNNNSNNNNVGGGSSSLSTTQPEFKLPSRRAPPDPLAAQSLRIGRNNYADAGGTCSIVSSEQFTEWIPLEMNVVSTPWDAAANSYKLQKKADPQEPLREKLALAELNVQRLTRRVNTCLDLEQQNLTLQTTVAHVRRRVAELEHKLQTQIDANDELRSEGVKAGTEASRLRRQQHHIEVVSMQVAADNDMLQRRQAESVSIEQENRELKARVLELETSARKTATTLEETRGRWKATCATMQDRVAELDAVNAAHRLCRDAATKQQDAVQRLESQVRLMQDEQEALLVVKEEHVTLQTAHALLQREHAEQSGELRVLQQQSQTAQMEQVKQKVTFDANVSALNLVTQQLVEVRAATTSDKQTIASLRSQLEAANALHATCDDKYLAISSSEAQLKLEVDALTTTVNEIQKSGDHVVEQHAQCGGILAEARAKIVELQTECTNAVSAHAHCAETAQQQRNALQMARTAHQECPGILKKLQDKYELQMSIDSKKDAQIQELKHEILTSQEHVEHLTRDLDSLQGVHKQCEERYQKAVASGTESKKDADRVPQLESDLSACQAALATQTNLASTLQLGMSGMEAQLVDSNKEKQALMDTVATLESQLSKDASGRESMSAVLQVEIDAWKQKHADAVAAADAERVAKDAETAKFDAAVAEHAMCEEQQEALRASLVEVEARLATLRQQHAQCGQDEDRVAGLEALLERVQLEHQDCADTAEKYKALVVTHATYVKLNPEQVTGAVMEFRQQIEHDAHERALFVKDMRVLQDRHTALHASLNIATREVARLKYEAHEAQEKAAMLAFMKAEHEQRMACESDAARRVETMIPQVGVTFVSGPDDGIEITEAPVDMPAYASGVRKGDIVKQVNCMKTHTKAEFRAAMTGVLPGDRIPLLVFKKKSGVHSTVLLTVGAKGYDIDQVQRARRVAALRPDDLQLMPLLPESTMSQEPLTAPVPTPNPLPHPDTLTDAVMPPFPNSRGGDDVSADTAAAAAVAAAKAAATEAERKAAADKAAADEAAAAEAAAAAAALAEEEAKLAAEKAAADAARAAAAKADAAMAEAEAHMADADVTAAEEVQAELAEGEAGGDAAVEEEPTTTTTSVMEESAATTSSHYDSVPASLFEAPDDGDDANVVSSADAAVTEAAATDAAAEIARVEAAAAAAVASELSSSTVTGSVTIEDGSDAE